MSRPGAGRPRRRHGSTSAPLAVLVLAGTSAPLVAQNAPQPGEPVRIELTDDAADRLRVASPVEGIFIMLQGANAVADTPVSGPVRLPLDAIEAIEVQRGRSLTSSIALGAGAGAALGVGMWQFLAVLCGSGCDTSDASTWAPAIATGILVGAVVGARASSGRRWVSVEIPR